MGGKHTASGLTKDKLASLMEQGYSYDEISDFSGYTRQSVITLACKYKLSKSFEKIQDTTIEHAIFELKNGKELTVFASELGIDYKRLTSAILSRSGYNSLTDIKLEKYDNSFFDIIDTPQKAIVLGMWVTDGFGLYKNRRGDMGFKLKAGESEIEMLKTFQAILGGVMHYGNYDTPKSGGGKSVTLQISNKNYAESMRKHGYGIQEKTKTYSVIKHPIDPTDNIFKFFMIGAICGDGSIAKLRDSISIVAKLEEQLHQYAEFYENIGVKYRFYHDKKWDTYALHTSRNIDFYNLATCLTSELPPEPNIEYPYLRRKFTPLIERINAYVAL